MLCGAPSFPRGDKAVQVEQLLIAERLIEQLRQRVGIVRERHFAGAGHYELARVESDQIPRRPEGRREILGHLGGSSKRSGRGQASRRRAFLVSHARKYIRNPARGQAALGAT